ncbi:MAG: type IV pilus twitching motility protein PilT [Planctomycetota bacterium]|jgi:twitching motility protein PilT
MPHTLAMFLDKAVEVDASDVHFSSGKPCKFRMSDTHLHPAGDVMTDAEILEIMRPAFGNREKDLMEQYHTNGGMDFSYQKETNGELYRYRINMYKIQQGEAAVAIRKINSRLPSFEDINLPKVYQHVVEHATKGLVLVCGETGSGKTTTLAAMLNFINQRRRENIITLEDPIEYVYTSDKSNVNQRQMGVDFFRFEMALKHLVREDPNIVLIGEMRDPLTIKTGIQMAETGHLVFSTLHTKTAPTTVERILNYFTEDEKPSMRINLANNLLAIMCQMLLPSTDGKRLPAVEVYRHSGALRDYIQDPEKTAEISTVIQNNPEEGMIDFNHSLAEHVKNDRISKKNAIAASMNEEQLASLIKGME